MNKLEILKKYWYWVLILFVLILFGFQKCQNNSLKDRIQLQSVQIATQNDSTSYYKAKNSALTAKVISVSVEKDNAKKALNLAGFETDKLLKENGVKWRNIVFALRGEIKALGSGTTILRDTVFVNSIDTVFASAFKWNNKFLFLNGSFANKDMKFSYQYKTPIDIISEKKGDSFVVSAYLGDPSALLTSANSITITPKKRWSGWKYLEFGIGLGTGYLIFK